jgi:hypothetical protein
MKLLLDKVTKTLEKAEEGKAGKWLDLMKAVDPKRYMLEGRDSDFGRQANALRISNGYGGGTPCLAIPAVPTGNYEIQAAVSFAKKGTLLFLLPLGGSSVGLTIRETGRFALTSVAGSEWPAKEARLPMADGGQVKFTIKVLIKAGEAEIRISPAGTTKAAGWKGPVAALSPKGWEKARLKSIAISVTDYPTALVHLLKLRSLSGKIQQLSPVELEQAKARLKAK